MPAANCRKLCPIIGSVLISLAGCNATQKGVVEEIFERLYTIQPTANITIENGDGTVLVYGTSLNEMRVHAVKKAYSRARLAQIVINVSANPDSVSITTKFPAKAKWALFDRSGTVDYTIVVPATADVSELTLHAGEILLDGMRGQRTRARLGDGRMFIRNCFSNFDVQIGRGNLTTSYDWWEKDKFSARANVAQGNVWSYFPGEASFGLLAQTVHGKVVSDFENGVVATSRSSDGIRLAAVVNGGGDTSIKLNVVDGNIRIVRTNP